MGLAQVQIKEKSWKNYVNVNALIVKMVVAAIAASLVAVMNVLAANKLLGGGC